jgi:hypothetical protein
LLPSKDYKVHTDGTTTATTATTTFTCTAISVITAID